MTDRTTDAETRIARARDFLTDAFDVARQEHALTDEEAARLLREFATHRAAQVPTTAPAEKAAEPPLLPIQAPELWADRDLNLREKPPAFVRRVYAEWLGHGLTRKALRDLDFDLYGALGVWLLRHPDDPIRSLLPKRSATTDALIERLSSEYSIEDLRKVVYTIDSRQKRQNNAAKARLCPE